jgi:hypothetical protein
MKETEAMQAFVEHMLTYTLRLVCIDPSGWPQAIASGFVIPVENHYRIVSAGHAIGANSQWTLETVRVSDSETLMFKVSNVRTLAQINPNNTADLLDLAWADLFPEKLADQLVNAPKKPLSPVELPIYQGPLDSIPDLDLSYGFAAWNNVEAHKAISTLRREGRCELNMRYLGIDPHNHLHRFEPVKFQGDAYYQGASGAPIADPTGLVVSMLVGGSDSQKCLWGLPLAEHAVTLMAT